MKLKEIKKILRENKIFPSKRLGQNFLTNEKVILEIIEAANLSKDDIVLEIGPGIGNLTQELAKRVKRVIAIEKDPRMIEILKVVLKDFNNLEIIQGDILKIPLHKRSTTASLLCKGYKVVANLPFYLTAPVIRNFLESKNPPVIMVLMVQKEVAQRICKKPPKMNLLAISVQFYAQVEIISYVSKKFFWPKPKIDSAIIKIVPNQSSLQFSPQFREKFFKIVRAGFSHPRKQIINNLTPFLGKDKIKVKELLLKSGVNPEQRAENLNLKKWLKLTKNLITFQK